MSIAYSGYTDETLAVAARHDDSAFAELLGRYLFIVRSCACGYKDVGIDVDDLVQEGIIGLMNAVKGYDENSKTPFSAFARLCIDRNIVSCVRGALRKKRILPSMLCMIDDNFPSGESDDPESRLIAHENIEQLYQRIAACLTGFEQTVLSMYLAGNDYKDIAVKLGCDRKAVDNAMQRLRKKLKK